MRKTYSIPYYKSYDYTVDVVSYVNGLKVTSTQTRYYYIPQYLLGIIMNIKRDNTCQVEYKLYNPQSPYSELDLSICSRVEDSNTNMVTINIERDLSSSTYKLFDEVYSYYSNNQNNPFGGKNSAKYVYDIFNKSSDFFLNPCSPFTSKYGTDVLTIDRYKDFYVRIDFCEQNCNYLGITKSYKNLGGTYVQISCQCPIKSNYNKQENIEFGPVIVDDENVDESTLSAKEKETLEEKRALKYDINFQFIKTQIFMCFKKILDIKSNFSKDNILGLLTCCCFLLIIILYIIKCIIGNSHLDETLKFIRLGKFDHGLNLFFILKDYLKEYNKRQESYKNRKNKKKLTTDKTKLRNENLIQTKHKIRNAEKNIRRKLEGKPMIYEDKKPDELELIRGRIKELEDQLKMKYLKKGLKNKKIKVHIGKANEEEDPAEIKNIKKEIKMTKKRLGELKKKKKEIDIEKMKYHSLSSIASIPSNPPKKILSELPMPEEISDHDEEINSKEKMEDINIKISKHKKSEKKKKKKDRKKEKKDDNLTLNKKKEDNKEEDEKKEEEEDKKEELEENKEEEKKQENDLISNNSKLNSSWETYDSNDPQGLIKKLDKEKKEKEKEEKKKEKEEKKLQIQKLLVQKREKDKKRRRE